MFVSKYFPVIGALAAGVRASPVVARTPTSQSFDLAKIMGQAVIYDGVAPAAVGATADVDLHVSVPNAVIQGTVDVQLAADFGTEPLVTIDLSGVQAYVELDIKADAEVYIAVEIVSSDKLSLDIPGIAQAQAALALALDLVLSIDAAMELSAGLYINFPQGSYVKVNLLTSTVVDHVLNDLVAKALPLSLGVEVDVDARITLQCGLRLRTELALGANIDPVGIPLLSAGADVSIWVNLCDYTSVIIGNPSPNCTTGAIESLSLDVGVAVELDVAVLDVLELSLAPTVSVTLAAVSPSTSCVHDCICSGTGSFTMPTTSAPASVPATASGSVPAVPTGSMPVGSGSVPPAGPTGSMPVGSGSVPPAGPTGSMPVGSGSAPPAGPTGSYPAGSGSVPPAVPSVPGAIGSGSIPPVIPTGTGVIPPIVPTGSYPAGSGSVPPAGPTGSMPAGSGSVPPAVPTVPGALGSGSIPPAIPTGYGSLPPAVPSIPGAIGSGSVPPAIPTVPGALGSGSIPPAIPTGYGSLPPVVPTVSVHTGYGNGTASVPVPAMSKPTTLSIVTPVGGKPYGPGSATGSMTAGISSKPNTPYGGQTTGMTGATGSGSMVTKTTPATGTITNGPNTSGMTTSTFFVTTTMTITSCAAHVVNCPASFTQKVVTEIVYAKTTVCPVAEASATAGHNGTIPAPVPTAPAFVIPYANLTTDCPKFTTYPATSATCNTFTPPATITGVVGTVSLHGPTSTVPVAATKPAPTKPAAPVGTPATVPVGGPAVGTTRPGSVGTTAPGSVGTTTPKPYGGVPTKGIVTAGAAKVVSHAGAFVALVAGAMLI